MLGATQVIGYGTLYYSFAILAGEIAVEFGWPVSWVFGAFSIALLFGGLAAPTVGRQVHRQHGAAAVMAVGSVAAAIALAATAILPGAIVFCLGLVAIQVAAALVLYDAAFVAIVQTIGLGSRRRITHLSLIAGFASTLFWPLTSWLHGFIDWRGVLLLFAAANLAICLPLHLLLAVGRSRREEMATSATSIDIPEEPCQPSGSRVSSGL